MKFKKLAVIAGVLLVAAIAALAIAVHLYNPRSLALSLAASVKANTGRELQFGDVKINVLPRPAVVLSDVRFGNAAWGSQPWLARAGRVHATVDALELLAGRLRIRHIEMSDAAVLLETNREGIGNWVTGSADADSLAWLKTIEIGAFSLEKLALTYRDGTTGSAMSAQLDSAQLAAGSATAPIRLDVRATVNGKKVEVGGTLGALGALIANGPGYTVEVDGKFGAATMSVHGTVDQPLDGGRFSLELRAQLPEFAEYVALAGANVPPLGPFRGATKLTGTLAAPAFADLDVDFGTPDRMKLTARGELTGQRSADRTYAWHSTGLDLTVQGAQFSDFGQWTGKPLPQLGAYRIAARMSGPLTGPELTGIDATVGGSGKPEIRLRGAVANLRAASGLDLQLVAAAGDWWHAGTLAAAPRLPPFRASARVRDTRHGYRVDNLELKIAHSTVSASLQVAQRGPRLHVTGKAASRLIDLARIAPDKSAPDVAAPAAKATAAADHWKFADVELDLNIGRLVFPDGRQLQSGSGRIALQDGRLKASALQATLGSANLKIDGSIADPQKIDGLDLKLAAQGGELADLLSFFGKKFPPVGPFQARAHLRGSLEAPNLTAIDATAGRSGQSLRASGQIEDALKWVGVDLALTANINDSVAAGRLLGMEVPRLPVLRASARVAGPQGGYAFDELKLALGRTSVQGRVLVTAAEPRPRVAATLSGTLVDLSELPSVHPKPDAPNPLLGADVDADLRFNRVVLPSRQALGPVSGTARLADGAVELKQFVVAVDGATATFDGKVKDPLTPAGFDLTVNAKITHGTGLAALTGLRLHDLPASTLSGRLTDVANGYAVAGLKLGGTATTMAGDVTITRGAKRFKVNAKTTSPLLDVTAFVHPAAAGGAPKPAVAGARIIPDVPLPLEVLRVIDADLDLRFDTVKFSEGAPLGPLLVRALIADGVLKAEPVHLTGKPGQTLTLAGTVDATRSAWALDVEGKGIDFHEIVTRFGRPDILTGGITDLALHLQGTGKSVAAILGSLNGDAQLKVGPHRIHNFAIPLDKGIVMHMFGLANPFLKADPNTEVKCFTARVPIKNGIITSEQRVATETAKYNAVMTGTVNLRTEGLDLIVTPIVRGEVTTVVRLSGTLAAPVVDVNAVGAIAKRAVKLYATVATLGAWWVTDTLIKTIAQDPSPCATALVP